MGDSKFFSNQVGSATGTLFGKFKGLLDEMAGLQEFNAVVGFFRSSGYFRIRQEMGGLGKIKILIGINIDNIFRKHPKYQLFLQGKEVADEAMATYGANVLRDIREANYSKEIEEGILQLIEDARSGKVELKIHPSKDIHAKFYLFLPQTLTKNSGGSVIMGSSNLSDSGLGIRPDRYELNVEMRDYDDVAFCKAEFDRLWKEGVPLTPDDVEGMVKKSYLARNATPFEIYMKVLIDYFGDILDDDISVDMPAGFTKYQYQDDAMKQGYQMLQEHNGFFLADVVGLGKTVVAAMIAKRFLSSERKAKILVIHPLPLKYNWEHTFKEFGFKNTQVQFITNGSLNKVLEQKDKYWPKEEYDLILVDEAHGFRNDTSEKYRLLQTICKSKRVNGEHKKIMLISATPLNNRPEDLYNLLLLFQDKRNSTIQINGSGSLQAFFDPRIKHFQEIMRDDENKAFGKEIKKLYDEIRTEVIDKVTVRRTRGNIKKNFPDDFRRINFPEIEAPRSVDYRMHDAMSKLFNQTVSYLTRNKEAKDGVAEVSSGIRYARYKAIKNINEPIKGDRYPGADQIVRSLAVIYRNFMVKRLESSFEAFHISLRNLRDATQGMLKMFAEDKVIIAPDWKGKVRDLMMEDKTLDEIIIEGERLFGKDNSGFAVYKAAEFDPDFVHDLEHDKQILDTLIEQWAAMIAKEGDPKLDVFEKKLKNEIFADEKMNPTRKLVVFTESKDTLDYLERELKHRLQREDILAVSSDNRQKLFEDIQSNFDANIPKDKQENKYNIILSTDVLAEGVNLHRANVIVNYDTPWNASRLMQRIGRVNRIGSVAPYIVNYMFYPSTEGDNEINLYKNALAKIQGFHAAYGEDSQIYSKEEIVEYFEFTNVDIDVNEDRRHRLLEEAREFRREHPKDYKFIKRLEPKSRTFRYPSDHTAQQHIKQGTTLAYIASDYKQQFYRVEGQKAEVFDFYKAVELFRAKPEEPTAPMSDYHHQQVRIAQNLYRTTVTELTDEKTTFSHKTAVHDKDLKKDAIARKFLQDVEKATKEEEVKAYCAELILDIERGSLSALTRKYIKLKKTHQPLARGPISDIETVEKHIREDYALHHSNTPDSLNHKGDSNPRIILSETFV